jgi:site-specific recombinase XerD
MTRIKLDFVQAFVDRHGKPRWYFRRRGFKRIRLPGAPGSPDFMQAYEQAICGAPQATTIGGKHTKPGTVDDLVIRYFASAAFQGLPSEATRVTYRGIIEGFRKEHGGKRVAQLQRDHIEHLFTKKIATPAAANNWLRMVRMLMKFAISKKMITTDPTAGIKTLRYATEGHPTWSEEDIAAFNERHSVGTKARLAMTLMLYTGCRRADAVLLGLVNIKNGFLTYTQMKNRIRKPVTLTIPVHPELRRVIEATPMVGVKTFLVTDYGKPFSEAGFGNWMRERCDEAGLSDCSSHGLRKAIARRMAEAGMSPHQIQAITGHTTLKEIERYTKAVRQKLMAETAMRGLDKNELANGQFEPIKQIEDKR